jgi:hypothetical protein
MLLAAQSRRDNAREGIKEEHVIYRFLNVAEKIKGMEELLFQFTAT